MANETFGGSFCSAEIAKQFQKILWKNPTPPVLDLPQYPNHCGHTLFMSWPCLQTYSCQKEEGLWDKPSSPKTGQGRLNLKYVNTFTA